MSLIENSTPEIENSTPETGRAGPGAQATWLGRVDASLEKSLERNTRVLPKGTNLILEGQEVHSIFLVKSGWLAASKSLPDGERQIVEIILPGEIHDPVSADGHTSFVTLETLSETQVIVIGTTAWARLLDDLPDLRHFKERADAAARSRQSERILRLGRSSAEARIAYVLIEFCMRTAAIGATGGDGTFHVPLGQQQLAEFTGLSAVHVCRTLRRLNRNGLITTGDHMDIEILDMRPLAALAGVDLDALRREIIPGAA
ncbi:CRP/FNR family transcriptional regulator [Rhodobacteraceae bacterium MBR-64]